ncbi:DUF7537 family lipoprotein [Natronorubrum sp. FCH18a]|uniref:DUF7537 family lipoprotein n=1 Tax=Natronorubrum sp. FCH18a TaxID=3447018 RepID=UPI003F518154
MHRRRLLALAGTVSTVAVAGCTSSDDSEEDEPTESTDETQEADSETSLDDFEFPEHASREGIDAVHITDEHLNTIQDSGSVTVSRSSEREFGRHSNEEHLEAQLSRAGIRATWDRGDYEEATWTEIGDSRGLIRRDGGFQETFQITSEAPHTSEILGEHTLELFAEGFSFGEAEAAVEIDGSLTAQYDVESVADSTTVERLVHADSIDDATGSVFVTEDGTLKRYSYDIEFDAHGESRSQSIETTYFDIGETTVTEPDWAETARAEGRQFTATKTDDGYLELELANGDSISAGSNVDISTPAGHENQQLSEALTVGDRIVMGADSAGLSIEINGTPDSSSGIDTRHVYLHIRSDGLPIYDGSVPL